MQISGYTLEEKWDYYKTLLEFTDLDVKQEIDWNQIDWYIHYEKVKHIICNDSIRKIETKIESLDPSVDIDPDDDDDFEDLGQFYLYKKALVEAILYKIGKELGYDVSLIDKNGRFIM